MAWKGQNRSVSNGDGSWSGTRNKQLQTSATCRAQPSRAKRGPAARSAAAAEGGRRRKAPGSRRRPPSLARASNKSKDSSLLAATELVAFKQLWSAGKRALHEQDFLDCPAVTGTCTLPYSCTTKDASPNEYINPKLWTINRPNPTHSFL